jgi:hypothetical protein
MLLSATVLDRHRPPKNLLVSSFHGGPVRTRCLGNVNLTLNLCLRKLQRIATFLVKPLVALDMLLSATVLDRHHSSKDLLALSFHGVPAHMQCLGNVFLTINSYLQVLQSLPTFLVKSFVALNMPLSVMVLDKHRVKTYSFGLSMVARLVRGAWAMSVQPPTYT